MPDPHHISTQINQPQVQGNLVVERDLVIYEGGYQVPRFLSALPQVSLLKQEGTAGGSRYLIGRDEKLLAIKEGLSQEGPLLLTGMGGVGKTALATAYLQEHKKEYKHLVWLEQVGDFATTIVNNAILLNGLQFKLSGHPKRDAQLILNDLANLAGPSLLVIDNAEQDLLQYRDLLPQGPEWQVLITSREQLEIGRQLDVEELSEEAAVNLFNYYYSGSETAEPRLDEGRHPAFVPPALGEDQNIRGTFRPAGVQKKIVQILGFHPLSIELVAKMAHNRRIKPIDKVLQLLEERGLQLERRADVSVAHQGHAKVAKIFPYLQSVFNWREANEMEDWLMKQFICLPPVSMPFDLLTGVFQIDEQQEEVWDELTAAFDSLVNKGWLQQDVDNDSYQMHRVIQAVLTEQLREKLSYDDIWRILISLGRASKPGKDLVTQIKFLPFIERINDVLSDEWLKEESFLALNRNLAELYRQTGQLQKGRAVLEILYQHCRTTYGLEQTISTAIQADLGAILGQLGEYEEALKFLGRALEVDLELDRNDPIRIVGLLSNIGQLQTELGNYPAAREFLENAYQIAKQSMESDDSRLLVLRTNLLGLKAQLGNLEEARDAAKEVLADSGRILGVDHHETHLRQVMLGGLCYELGELEEAEQLLRNSLSWQFENLGMQNLNTTKTGASLAAVLMSQDRVEEAIPLFELAFKTYLNTYEPGSLVALQSMMNLAAAYQQQGRKTDDAQSIQDALEMYQSALDICLEFHPASHPLANQLRGNLAVAYADFGRFAEAQDLLEEGYKYQRESLGEEHPSTQNTLANLEAVRRKIKK